MQLEAKENIEWIPIGQLKPHPKNRNQHSPEQIERLAEIIKYQGWRHPIIVSTLSGYIAAGHGRLLAAKKLGLEQVPVHYQSFQDDTQEYAFLVSDNSIALWAELDLSGINADLGDLGPDFDINLLGLKDFVLEPADKNENDPDAVPEPPKEAKTKTGELWILGNHRLLIGDCTVKENVHRLMDGQKAEMVFTDPPYNHAGKDDLVASPVSQAMQRLKDSEWDKNFSIEAVLENLESALAADCSIYICTSWHLAGKIWDYYSTRSTTSGYCVWSKPNPMPSLMKRHWTWASELICYATRGKHVFNFPQEGHARNVWEIQKSQKNDLHPTMKPVELCEYAITHSSNPGQIVADLFLGSGSTLIACEKTGRKCYGMEIDTAYADVIIQRWMKYTGQEAYLEDGTPFSNLSSGI